MIKKLLKFFGILLLVIIIAAIAVPYFFKDKIVEAVKEDINKSINAKVDFTDVSLSLFKSFPDFNFELDELSVTGIDAFEGYPLVKANQIEFSLDLMSVINSESPIEINTIRLDKPEINIKVLKNGLANYDIVKPSPEETTETEATNFLVQLQEYSIDNGTFIYDDRLGGTYAAIEGLNHSGEGAFSQDVFDLITQTEINSLTAKSGGIAYLNKAKADIDLTLNADITNSKYTIKENQINLNALTLNAEGFVELLEDVVNIDFKYDAPKNNFKNFLSMIPSAYTADYKDVEANGSLTFNGFVKGAYNMTSGALPAFQVNLKVDDGNFKYPDLPLGINGINTVTKINSPSSNLDKMVVDVSSFNMELGKNPFAASIKLWQLLSDPNIDSKITGKINLEELAQAFPIEGVKKLNGIISSNLVANTSMSAIDKQEFEAIDMSGDLRIEGMDYQSEDFPPVKISDMQMEFTPKFVKLDQFKAQLGKSDVEAKGTIDNIMAYFAPEKTMTGKLTVRSNFFDSNEWMAEEEETPAPVVETSTEEEYEVFDRFDFTIDGRIDKLLYDVYELKNNRLVGQVTPNKAVISEFRTDIGESDFNMSGTISNIFDYLYENETMKGDIKLVSNYINVNEFMVEVPEDTPKAKPINNTPEELGPVLIPEKMDFDINANIKKVLYTNIDMKDIKGDMKIANEAITLKDCDAKSLGGSFTMNGTYDTKDPAKPTFDMDYDVKRLDFQNAFEKLNTFAALAPIGKFIEGQFNTTLKVNGILGQDMMPDLSTLTANGFLQTIDGALKNFKPVEEFANKLNLDFLKSVDLKNTKNWFEVKDGQINIKEFPYKVKGIEMNIGGSHGISTDMKYNIKAKVPRELLTKNKVIKKGLGFLGDQAKKLGININESEFINVAAVIGGTMTKPNVDVKLLNGEGEAISKDNLIETVKDTLTSVAKDQLEKVTGFDYDAYEAKLKALYAERDAKIESVMKKSDAEVNKLVDDAKQEAEKARAKTKQQEEKIKAEAYKQADKLVEKAGSNPFKKKAAQIAAKEAKKKADKVFKKALDKSNTVFDNAVKAAENKGEDAKAKARKETEGITKEYSKKIEDLEATKPEEEEK